MSLDSKTFTVHDVEQFPFVIFNEVAVQPGYAPQWETEMVALLEHGKPFVLVYDHLRNEETHEDRKHRGIWLKKNKNAIGHVCKLMISIETDEQRKAQINAMGEVALKAFGIGHDVVGTRKEAMDVCNKVIGTTNG